MKIAPYLFIVLFTCSASLFSQEKDMRKLISEYNKVGYDFLQGGIYDSAELYLQKTLEMQEAFLGHFNDETASTYSNLGVLYRNLNNFQASIKALNTAELILEQTYPDSPLLAFIYNNKGNLYFNYTDFAEAELYYRYCLDLLNKGGHDNDNFYDVAIINLFNILVKQNKHHEASKIINELDFSSSQGETVFRRHLFIAYAYETLGQYEDALNECQLAKKELDHIEGSLLPLTIIYNYRIAVIKTFQEKYDEATFALLQNINLLQKNRIAYNERYFESALLIGNIYYLKQEYKNCLSWIEKTIEKTGLENGNNSNLFSSSIKKFKGNQIVDLIRLHAKASNELFNQTNNINYLYQSLDSYKKCINHIQVSRIHMRNEKSQYIETENRISLVQEAIETAIKTFEVTNDIEYLEQAFDYNENIKSFSLLSEIKDNEAIQFADLPPNILNKESSLTSEIAAYEEFIFTENSNAAPDSSKLAHFNDKLFNLKDDYNTFLDSLEHNYPNYFHLKYNPRFISLNDIQIKLDRKEALVEYVLTDTMLYTFLVDKEEINLLKTKIDTSFRRNCVEYFTILQSQDFNQNVHDTYKRYVELGRMFYETLVAPALELTKNKEITFIPDGEIMYLPFESFITEDVDAENINYHELPYLIHELSIGYSYSSTLLFSERHKSKSPVKRVLAFAPAYENLQNNSDPLEWNRDANPLYLTPLKGAREEVQNISRSVPSTSFLDYEATEGNFKKFAPDYSILHLAMHAVMDDDKPMYSRLAFARTWKDSTEDHDLFTYEIYNMNLNADMVVLSSCNSGFGKMQKGEGMMSMSRGFIYAGCPSIIMTLWPVSDLSSSKQMSAFYKYLKRGKSKKSALRQAKIDYINSSDKIKSNPYFWAAFLVVGDTSPLYGASASTYLILIISTFLLLIVFITYRKPIIEGSRKLLGK